MKLKSIFAWLASALVLTAAPLKTGDELPKLEGTNQDGKVVKLEAGKDHKWLLIFTYPKAMTGG